MSTATGVWLASTFRDRAALHRRASALAAALPVLGAPGTATVMTLARNSFLPLEVTIAVAQAGMRVVPASPHATARDLAYLLSDSGRAS